MKLDQVQTIAKSQGIHLGKLSKSELIKSIQSSEGNFDCFSSARIVFNPRNGTNTRPPPDHLF